jgi:hypothetical protein
MTVDHDNTTRSTDRLDPALTDVLFVQVDAPAYADALECSDRPGGGLILSKDNALTVAEYIVDQGRYQRPVLADRRRYAGKNRRFASDAFDTTWLARQQRLGLPAFLPDAGYVGEGDEAGLVSILNRVADLGPGVVAPLALHLDWLHPKRDLGRLSDHVQNVGVPIALALEHSDDPLSARYAVHGLVRILELPVQTILLGCDVSAIGALCFGATAAAVGTTTGLRHIYPMPKDDAKGGFGGTPKPAAVVRGCLSYVWLDKIALAVQADRDNKMWECTCRVCGGQTLDWLGSAPEPETVAFQHSLEMLYQIRRDLMGRDTIAGSELATSAERRQSWIAQCDSALFQHEAVLSTMYRWDPPKTLGNWISLGPQVFPQPSTP